ncbi:MAG: hypothetical protein M3Y41_11515 [Pseudomonadota bacterium]|nr:hypothetical protein [Pseudomonadota bacterium]
METRTPLLVIDRDTRPATYQTLLRYAVRQAESRKPGVAFDVVSIVPGEGSPSEQVKAAQSASLDAGAVAREIVDAGVSDGQVHLGARADPDASHGQVRVYVR